MVQAMEEAGEYHTSDKSTQYSVKWFSSFLEAAKTNATIWADNMIDIMEIFV